MTAKIRNLQKLLCEGGNVYLQKKPQTNLDTWIFEQGLHGPLIVRFQWSKTCDRKWPKYITIYNLLFEKHRLTGKGAYGEVMIYKNEEQDIVYAVKYTHIDESVIMSLLGRYYCGAIPLRRLYSSGSHVEGGSKYFIMPLMQGTLTRLQEIISKPVFTKTMFCDIVTRLCNIVRVQILCMFEQTNIPYLDLKPDNILYRCNTKSEFEIHVADIGSLHLDDSGEIAATFPPPESADNSGYVGYSPKPNSQIGLQMLSWSLGTLFLSFIGFTPCPYILGHTTLEHKSVDIPQYISKNTVSATNQYYAHNDYVWTAQNKLEVYFGKQIGNLLHPDPTLRTTLTKPLVWSDDGISMHDYQVREQYHLNKLLPPGWTTLRENVDSVCFLNKTTQHVSYVIPYVHTHTSISK